MKHHVQIPSVEEVPISSEVNIYSKSSWGAWAGQVGVLFVGLLGVPGVTPGWCPIVLHPMCVPRIVFLVCI